MRFTLLVVSCFFVGITEPTLAQTSYYIEGIIYGPDSKPLEHIVVSCRIRPGLKSPNLQLNQILTAYNQNFAGKLTPAGQNRNKAKKRKPIAALQEAIRIFPDYFDARFVLANELAAQGRFDKAIRHLEKARGINPKDDRVNDLFARIMMQERKYAVAARIYTEAARLNPADPQYPLSQGTAFIEQASRSIRRHRRPPRTNVSSR